MATNGNQQPSPLTEDQVKLLADWEAKSKLATAAIAAERDARDKCFNAFFKDPREGTNNFPLASGYTLKGKLPVARKVLEEELEPLKTVRLCDLSPGFLQAHNLPSTEMPAAVALRINFDTLIVRKPELALKEYRTLTEGQRAFFDRCLEIKPGMAGLELAEPKKA